MPVAAAKESQGVRTGVKVEDNAPVRLVNKSPPTPSRPAPGGRSCVLIEHTAFDGGFSWVPLHHGRRQPGCVAAPGPQLVRTVCTSSHCACVTAASPTPPGRLIHNSAPAGINSRAMDFLRRLHTPPESVAKLTTMKKASLHISTRLALKGSFSGPSA